MRVKDLEIGFRVNGARSGSSLWSKLLLDELRVQSAVFRAHVPFP